MTETERRPGEADRGDVDDQHRAGEVRAEGIPEQLRRRRAASWRCEPLAGGHRDPWADWHAAGWTEAELESWGAAAGHLRGLELFGSWQVPELVRAAWQRRSCACCRGAA
ncbi:MAG: hypothetical protein ACRDSP_24575 [Pseudonocardiaceae bacterium]